MRVRMSDGSEAVLERREGLYRLEADWGGCTTAEYVRSGFEWVRMKTAVDMADRGVSGVADLLAVAARTARGVRT